MFTCYSHLGEFSMSIGSAFSFKVGIEERDK